MNADEALDAAREWIRFALEDLRAAQTVELSTRIRCFHGQRAAEKAIKGALTFEGTEFPKTHNLVTLRDMLQQSTTIEEPSADMSWLSRWAVNEQYPGPEPDPPLADADRAAALAQGIVDAARAYIERQG